MMMTHIPKHCPFRMQTKLLHVIFYTLSPSLNPASASTLSIHHLHISTGWHPIIFIFTFQMPNPSQSYTTMPRHLNLAPKTVQDLTSLPFTLHTSTSPCSAIFIIQLDQSNNEQIRIICVILFFRSVTSPRGMWLKQPRISNHELASIFLLFQIIHEEILFVMWFEGFVLLHVIKFVIKIDSRDYFNLI